ncbi:MAG: hypothetical protein OEM01_03070 [Desulfobulbaceae bacterium]|nr:hypothetical protein [Desulfobulbaceae bacterium]
MSNQLATLGELFSSSWEEYKKRAMPILAVILISTGVVGSLAVVLVLFAGFGGAFMVHANIYQSWFILMIAFSCALFFTVIILGLWFHTAMLAIVVDESLGIIEAFRRGWKYLWPMTWVMGIFSGIIVTGFIFGILPGILCLVWFSFSFYILLEEDKRGMDSMLASMEYVRGDWWNIFGKLFVVWFLYLLISIIPFVGTLISIFFYPFLMLFMVAVYHDLKSHKGEAEVLVSSGTRLLWWVITAIGLIVPVVALIGALIALLNGDSIWFEQASYSFHGKTI